MKHTEAEICEWCRKYLSTTLALPASQIDPQAKFSQYGMDSASLVSLLVGLEDWLNIEIDPEIAFEHPTIAALAKHLVSAHGDK